MTKTLLTKIVIGVLATGTVGTVGLVVASKVPVTSQAVKSVPTIAKYVDIVTFNKGLSDEELTKVLDRDKYFYEPRIIEWKEQHGIYNNYNNPAIYSNFQIIYGDNDLPDETSILQEFNNWYNEVLVKDVNKIMLDAMSRATAEQAQQIINKYEHGESREPYITYTDENGQTVTIKGRDNINEYYRSQGIDTNSR